MRTSYTVMVLVASTLAAVHAQDQESQSTLDTPSSPPPSFSPRSLTFPNEDEPWQATPDDYPFKPTTPDVVTEDQALDAKQAIQQLLAQLPVKRVEPLFTTLDGYCTAFKGLCTAACNERIKLSKTRDRDRVEVVIQMEDTDYQTSEQQSRQQPRQEIKGCVDPLAGNVASAGAACKCAGYDMTDRINFAVVGGVVTSESKADFGAEGLLDNLTLLPAVPTFLNIIHILQNICFYIGFLDILATNPHPSTCPANPISAIGNLIPGVGPIMGLIPGLGGLTGGGGGTGAGGGKDNSGGIGALIGGLFGGGKKEEVPIKKDDGGIGATIGNLLGGLFGGGGNGGGANTSPSPAPGTPVSAPAPPPPPPATTPKPRDKLFGIFSDNEDAQLFGANNMDKHEVDDIGIGANRLISNDGRVAKIVRMKARHAMKTAKNEA
ncbi:hypothetical protein BG004_001003 [Podila humilis]|nr:hypothetical protein BG004_001003 [Podila humilis]